MVTFLHNNYLNLIYPKLVIRINLVIFLMTDIGIKTKKNKLVD